MLTAAVTSYSNRMNGASGSETTRARRNRTPRAVWERTTADHSGFACSGRSLRACQSRNRWSSGVYASRISRCTADVVVAAISSPNGGTLAIKRLQDHRPHPRLEPDHRLVVRYRAVPCDIRQGLRVGDRPVLEEEITSLLLGENRWTVVPRSIQVDCHED